jgi:predicted secreted protein
MSTTGGFGVQVQITTTGLTAVANMTDVDAFAMRKILADVTAHDSTAGYAEHIATGKREIDSFKCTLVWDVADTTHAAIVTAFDSDDPVAMAWIDPASSETISGNAHIAAISRIAQQDAAYTAEIEIQPTGQWTIA